jgi:hypothetical protein
MKFKLNNAEMMALIERLLNCVEHDRILMSKGCRFSPDALLHASIMEELVVKLQMKAIIKKQQYTLKLQPYQAISFWIIYNGTIPETTMLGNMVQTMCNAIHQQILSK